MTERYITETELKEWFTEQIEKYKNCPIAESFQQVYFKMFDPWFDKKLFDKIEEKRVDK